MIIQNRFLDKGHPNRPGKKLEALKAIVFHYTANDSPEMGALNTIKYFNRKYIRTADSIFFERNGMERFRFGSTHYIADAFDVYCCIPPDEIAYACNDRSLPYTKEWKGQQPAASKIFQNRQNFQSISIEICNNDIIPQSNKDWEMACNNAIEWAIEFIKWNSKKINLEISLNPQNFVTMRNDEILLLRHFDLTGKICPKPFIDNPDSWHVFVEKIAKAL